MSLIFATPLRARPVNERWNDQSMYTAARITPNVATIAYGRS